MRLSFEFLNSRYDKSRKSYTERERATSLSARLDSSFASLEGFGGGGNHPISDFVVHTVRAGHVCASDGR